MSGLHGEFSATLMVRATKKNLLGPSSQNRTGLSASASQLSLHPSKL
jgi:hypothetical protein